MQENYLYYISTCEYISNFWVIKQEVPMKHLLCILKHDGYLKKSTCTIIWAVSQISHYVYEMPLLRERITDKLVI